MPGRVIVGNRGWVVEFHGEIPPVLAAEPDEVIRAWLVSQFAVMTPILGHLKANNIRLVQLGIDGRPVSSGPALHG